jgi:multidrug efflux pump subunit AcrA (membrane-fusion protein)
VLAVLVLAAPLPYKVRSDCVVKPTVRRFAVAPYDGILQNTLRETGDLVRRDQVLARMDDRELRFEKSELTAQRARALKQRDVHLNARDVAAAQISDLQAKELAAKLEWLRHREDNLAIKSPIDGVVLSGDMDDAQGAPVQTGQLLFEIAPLDSLRLEVAVLEEDVLRIEPEMRVSARLEGAPGRQFAGRVTAVLPQARVERGRNVFVAEVELDEPGSSLRPGMNGTAKLIGPPRALGWILFHKAFRRAVDFLEW